MAQAFGPVSIVIPPWNGLLGRVLSLRLRKALTASSTAAGAIAMRRVAAALRAPAA